MKVRNRLLASVSLLALIMTGCGDNSDRLTDDQVEEAEDRDDEDREED